MITWVDYAILAIVALSALISILRGFIREAISLLGWILAFWVSLTFTEDLARHFVGHVSVPSARLGLAFFALFAATLLLTGLVNFLAGQLVEKTGLTGTDRMLGVLFGVGRGAIIVAVLVLLAGLTAMPQDPWWRDSVLLRHFQVIATEIRGFLPPDLAAYIKY